MSYLQETQIAAAGVDTVQQQSGVLPGRLVLALLLLWAFLQGALYAAFLPPWGLIDEAQHLDYIQHIAEQQKLPTSGDLYLSDQIVASLFATHRWETFHWSPPPSPDPRVMGLEGHSYEVYQPPLFYLLMTPAYLALPADILVKVYGLRMLVVALSLITVWATYRSAEILLPQYPGLPFWAAAILVSIPERAIATSRINNDILLEVVAALFFLTLTHAIVSGLSMRRSLLLGALVGLGIWAKASALLLGVPLLLLFWLRRHEDAVWKQVGWAACAAAPFGLLLALRNLWQYGDLSGFSEFVRLQRLAPTDLSWFGIVKSVVTLPNHLWLVWWKGSDAGENPLLTLFYLLMGAVVVWAWGRLALEFWRQRAGMAETHFAFVTGADSKRGRGEEDRGPVVGGTPEAILGAAALIYSVTVLVYALFVLVSLFQGVIPVTQGRFMLPAIVPFVLLLVWGLWLTGRGRQVLPATLVLLCSMGLLSLFGNLIPYYYYWSGVLKGTMPPLSAVGLQVSLRELAAMVFQRMLQDKPSFFSPILLVLPLLYGLTLLAALFVGLRTIPPFSSSGFRAKS